MKLYPFPEPKIHLRRRATSRGRREIYWDHQTRVIRNMGRNALRRIHELKKLPTVDELQAWIVDHHPRAFDYFDTAEKMAEDAAVFALDAFDADEYERRVQRARNGGKVSGYKKGARGKRPPMHGTDTLTEGLSIAEQAKELGCSVATIKRMRARLKAEISQQQDEELDALFGPESATEPVSEAIEARTTSMTDQIPNTVPAAWVDEIEAVIAAEQREAESRVSAADFADIEVS